MYWLTKLSNIIDYFCKILLGLALASLTVVVILQVFARSFLGFSYSWADELARYLLVFITFIGAGSALKHQKLASVTIFLTKVPQNISHLVLIVVDLLIIFFSSIMIYHGVTTTFSHRIVNQVSPAMGLPMYWIYIVIPLGGLFMLIHTLSSLCDRIFPGKEVVKK